jgi:hypothetical protein
MKVDISCNRDDASCVTKAIADYSGDGNILICWEHHKMTDLVEALGCEDAPQYPDDRLVPHHGVEAGRERERERERERGREEETRSC